MIVNKGTILGMFDWILIVFSLDQTPGIRIQAINLNIPPHSNKIINIGHISLNSHNFVVIIDIIKPKPIIDTGVYNRAIITVNLLVNCCRWIAYEERRRRGTNANQAVTGPNDEKMTKNITDFRGKEETDGVESWRVQVEGIDAEEFSHEYKQAIVIGRKRMAEVTLSEFRG